MKLKKVKIVGFKSFADRVHLDFHDGITGVVGPNGCGKSNIADAFRWVMGEQSAKSMRGGKMQDVIFAGTSSRKPVGLAEVSLTFANTEGRVGIPYTDVEITRRYHRDGESEYLINGNSVRLKDIQSILMDVGIGKNAYAIFEQGKIDQIIQLGPEERRTIFEEAAGILKFLINKRDTEKKLGEIELNASRIKDIHNEVQKEISLLSSQAGRAREFHQLKGQIDLLQEEILRLKLAKKLQKLDSQELDESKFIQICGELTAKLEAAKIDLAKKKELLEENEAALKEKEKALYQAKSLQDLQNKEFETLKERAQENQQKVAALTKERERLTQDKETRKHEMTSRQREKLGITEALESQRSSLEKAKLEFLEVEKKLTLCRKEVEKTQEKVLALTRSSGIRLSEWKQKNIRLEALKDKIAASEKSASEFMAKHQKLAEEEKEKREILEKASKEVDENRHAFNLLDQEIKAISQELEEVSRHFDIVNKDRMELKAREKALLKLQEDLEGVSSGTKTLLKESKDPKSPLFEQLKGLWEYFTIQPGFEEAVATVLKPYSDTLVVETQMAYEKTLAWVQEKNLVDFSLIFIDPKSEIKSDESSLLKKVKVNAAAAHFLGKKAVVEDLSKALSLIEKKNGYELFSLDGYFIDHSKTLFRSSQKGGSQFLREAEIKALADKIKTLDEEFQTYKSRLDILRETRTVKSENRIQVDKKVRSLEMQLIEKNFAVQRSLQEQQTLLQLVKEREIEKAKATEEVSKAEIEIVTLKKQNEEEELKLKSEEALKESSQKHLEDLLKTHRKAKENLNLEDGKFQKSSDEARKVAHTLSLLEVKDHESIGQEERLKRQINELQEASIVFEAKQKELQFKVKDQTLSLERITKDTAEFDQLTRSKKDELKKIEIKLIDDDQILKKEQDKLKKVELDKALAKQEIESIEIEFAEKLPAKELSLTKELAKSLTGDLSQLEKDFKKAKDKLGSYSDVNLAAAETLDHHKERADYLQKEMGDLTESSDELNAIIQKLADESRELFKTTLEAVRINFKKNFQILFNGGEADLELTNSDDILKAGVEIVAKPPGKQMRSINLLSGGEKCLTAMALLFSIFEVKAAPFCILDEIDAPLDDSNVERFCTMVKHFADRCQFIVITHNKRTMAMADRLYGISMEEKGVSKMLMMEFQHADKQEVALVEA